MPAIALGFVFLLLGGAESTDPHGYEDSFAPMIAFVFFFVVLVGFVILVGVGVAAGLILAAAVAGMVGFGVFTTSTLAGFLTRRPSTAAKALILQLSALGGTIAGLGLGGAVHAIAETGPSLAQLTLTGALAGLAGGLAIALIFNTLWPRWLRVAGKVLPRPVRDRLTIGQKGPASPGNG